MGKKVMRKMKIKKNRLLNTYSSIYPGIFYFQGAKKYT
jgi:hypothetical protein